MAKTLLFAFVFALIYLTPAVAQTGSGAQADASPIAANAVPDGQAPDEVMKKLSDLVHAGKYAEAQQLTTGLLMAYPDDQRLIKAKELLDKPLANAAATTKTPGNPAVTNQTSTQPAANEKGGLFSGMDKVDYNALIALARQAQQNTDLEQQKVSLKQFMDQSGPFLQKHPNQMLLWQLRAASAISLDDAIAGYEAGQKLLAASASDSDDPNLQQLLAGIKTKGWLDKQESTKQAKYNWILGTWVQVEDDNEEITWTFRKSDSGNIEMFFGTVKDGPFLKLFMRETILNSGEISWERDFYDATGEPRSMTGWQPITLSEIASDKRTMIFSYQTLRKDRQKYFFTYRKIGGS